PCQRLPSRDRLPLVPRPFPTRRSSDLPSAAFVENVEPSDAALSAFYSKNGSRYTIPERRTISYALFSKDRFNETIKPTEKEIQGDRKSTRLNSSHVKISYAVCCLKKKN